MATRTFKEKTTTTKSTLTWITEKELEQEIKNKGDQLPRKNDMKILELR